MILPAVKRDFPARINCWSNCLLQALLLKWTEVIQAKIVLQSTYPSAINAIAYNNEWHDLYWLHSVCAIFVGAPFL